MKAADDKTGPAAQHWFTATPDPLRSIYKPFGFPKGSSTDDGRADGQSIEQQPQQQQHAADESSLGSPYTVAGTAPRNPSHPLWRAWQSTYEKRGGSRPPLDALQELEARGLDPSGGLSFAKAVEEEMRLYGA